MEIFIILIAWFAVGCVYLINLSASNAIDNISEISFILLFIIFLPTFIVIFFAYLIYGLVLGIQDSIERFENDRSNKRMQRSNKK